MKVYVSSTYEDLAQYRAAVDRTLRRMGHDVIGMEQYVAEGSKPVDRCVADVQAADAYVIIVAWRYGHVPGRHLPTPDLRSVTEIELDAAMNGKPVLAFLLDPQAPWPPNRIDAMGGVPGAGEAVAALRSRLGSNYLAGIFRTPDDLASQVAAAVSAQGLTRQMVKRVLEQTSVATPDVDVFANGAAPLVDSGLISIKDMIRTAGSARALVLQIGDGERWWSTRLFLLASLLRSLTAVRQVVFSDEDGRFGGMATPTAIVDALAAKFAVLERFARKLGSGESSADIEWETDRQTSEWRDLFDQEQPGTPGIEVERKLKVGVRASLLSSWLGERWVGRCIRTEGVDLSMAQVQQIVDSLLPDVPVERHEPAPEPTGRYKLLVVDRDSFALELAREWVRSGLPRSTIY